MFQVKRKDNFDTVRTVFDTKENTEGELLFLTFGLDSWYWIPANEYVPIDYN